MYHVPEIIYYVLLPLDLFSFRAHLIRKAKIGHGSADCHNPNAVVVLNSGSSTEDMQSIFNSRTPSLPIWIAFCIVSGKWDYFISFDLHLSTFINSAIVDALEMIAYFS